MPTLHGFDEEFGQDPGVTQLGRTHSFLLAAALGAAILGGFTLVWLAVDGGVRPKGASAAPTSPQNTAPAESRELVDRLLTQVEALKSEIRELTEAQQQPAQANAAIEAEQESVTELRPYIGTQTPLRCRPGSRADLSRGASCRFRDGQRAHVLHCVEPPFPPLSLAPAGLFHAGWVGFPTHQSKARLGVQSVACRAVPASEADKTKETAPLALLGCPQLCRGQTRVASCTEICSSGSVNRTKFAT